MQVATPFQHCTEAEIEALEAWLDGRRQAASLMARAAHDGRPPMDSDLAGVVNGQEVRVTERGAASPTDTLPDGRPIVSHTASITVSSRRWRLRGTEAAVAAAVGAGRTWTVFTPARRAEGSSRPETSSGAKQAASSRVEANRRMRSAAAANVAAAFAD